MLTAIGDVMREAHKRGWITTRDGNISLRRGNKFYITPSAVRKTIIHPEHIKKAKFDENGYLQFEDTDKTKPSIELEMHRKIQRIGKKTKAVVHLHPTYTIALMYRCEDPECLSNIASAFPELSRYTKVGPVSFYEEPGSQALADVVYSSISSQGKFLKYDIVGLDRHGVVAVGDNPWDAFEHIERLEHICQIALASGVVS